MEQKRPIIHSAVKAVGVLSRRCSGFLSTAYLRSCLALNGCRPGKRLRAFGFPLVQVSQWGSIHIGEGVTLISRRRSNLSGIPFPVTLQTMDSGEIRIGDNVGISGSVLSSRASITVESHVNIGTGVKIYDHDYHSLNHEHRRDGAADKKNVRSKPVVIGEDAFIGGNSIILKGTKIGARSIIGAGSVVAGLDIPPDSRVAGNPAKIL